MTVVRGEGECMAIVNGVVQKEIARLQAENRRRAERERMELRREISAARAEADTVRRSRNRMLEERLFDIRRLYDPPEHRIRTKIRESASTAWAVVMGTMIVILGLDR